MDKQSAQELVVLAVLLKTFESEIMGTLGPGDVEAAKPLADEQLRRIAALAAGNESRYAELRLEAMRDALSRAKAVEPRQSVADLPDGRPKRPKIRLDFWDALARIGTDPAEGRAARLIAAAMFGNLLWKDAEILLAGAINLHAVKREAAGRVKQGLPKPPDEIDSAVVMLAAEGCRRAAPLFADGGGPPSDESCRSLAEAIAIVGAYRPAALRIVGRDGNYWVAEAVREEKRLMANAETGERQHCRHVLGMVTRLLDEAAGGQSPPPDPGAQA